MSNLLWVYEKGKFVSKKELKEMWEKKSEKFGEDCFIEVAVYRMMPRARRPEFDTTDMYTKDGFLSECWNK